jgi:hypothetical protein
MVSISCQAVVQNSIMQIDFINGIRGRKEMDKKYGLFLNVP